MRVLIIIPAFNEAASIGGVVRDVRRAWSGDIVVIDDGSEDATAIEARRAGVEVVSHPCNLGVGAAVQTGFLYALRGGYDAVVRLDGDGQHDPADIDRFIDRLRDDAADIVVGSRFLAREGYQPPLIRRLGILILSVVSALVGTHVTDPTSGYWALNRRALELLARFHPDDYPETQALVLATRAGCRVAEIPVVMLPRIAGRSSLTGAARAGFYMGKVILALLIERLRRR